MLVLSSPISELIKLSVRRSRIHRGGHRHSPQHRLRPCEAQPDAQEHSIARRDKFALFIHKTVSEAVSGLPEFGVEWMRSAFAGQMLERKLKQDEVFEFFSKWGRTSGGYIIPKSEFYALYCMASPLTSFVAHKDFAGTKFSKKFAFDLLGLKSSSTSETDTYFSTDYLQSAPKVKDWFESKGQTNDSRFRKMRTARFKEYMDDHYTGERTSRRVFCPIYASRTWLTLFFLFSEAQEDHPTGEAPQPFLLCKRRSVSQAQEGIHQFLG